MAINANSRVTAVRQSVGMAERTKRQTVDALVIKTDFIMHDPLGSRSMGGVNGRNKVIWLNLFYQIPPSDTKKGRGAQKREGWLLG